MPLYISLSNVTQNCSVFARLLLCRFRLVAKTMAAFLAAQMPSDASLRLNPGAPGFLTPGTPTSPKSPSSCTPSQQARQTFAVLESLRSNKNYATYRQTVDIAIDSVASQHLSFRDSATILSQLVTGLFPEINCVETVRRLPV